MNYIRFIFNKNVIKIYLLLFINKLLNFILNIFCNQNVQEDA